jgi:hypothetical protein
MPHDSWTLGAALVPYLVLVSVDSWMHEKARRVPRLEQFFHAAAAVVVPRLRGRGIPRFPGGVAAAHRLRGLRGQRRIRFSPSPTTAAERRVHFMSYAPLAIFIVAWRLAG